MNPVNCGDSSVCLVTTAYTAPIALLTSYRCLWRFLLTFCRAQCMMGTVTLVCWYLTLNSVYIETVNCDLTNARRDARYVSVTAWFIIHACNVACLYYQMYLSVFAERFSRHMFSVGSRWLCSRSKAVWYECFYIFRRTLHMLSSELAIIVCCVVCARWPIYDCGRLEHSRNAL